MYIVYIYIYLNHCFVPMIFHQKPPLLFLIILTSSRYVDSSPIAGPRADSVEHRIAFERELWVPSE